MTVEADAAAVEQTAARPEAKPVPVIVMVTVVPRLPLVGETPVTVSVAGGQSSALGR